MTQSERWHSLAGGNVWVLELDCSRGLVIRRNDVTIHDPRLPCLLDSDCTWHLGHRGECDSWGPWRLV